jgi:hypothetical protein
MAVYRPKRKGESSKFYTCEFIYQGKRFQESTGTTSKTVAKEYEKRRRAELERAAAGLPTVQKSKRIRTVSDVIEPYLAGYGLNHRPQSVLFSNGRLAQVKRQLGDVILSDLTEERIKSYIRQRQSEEISGRTINMELGELSRAIGQPWSLLWPNPGLGFNCSAQGAIAKAWARSASRFSFCEPRSAARSSWVSSDLRLFSRLSRKDTCSY